MAVRPRLYGELAEWWPLLSSPDDYAEEAALYTRLLRELAGREVTEVLELGSGGGNNASHMRQHFELTLVDLSAEMLEVSKRLNPGCEHHEGDMRTVRLGRAFDAVFVHDAVCYLTTPEDLRAAMRTAWEHLRPGGLALFVPDETTEVFGAGTQHGGHDGDGRSLRYLEWTREPDPGSTVYPVVFVLVLHEDGEPLRVVMDEHTFGMFPRATWLELLEETGFEVGSMRHAYGTAAEGFQSELFYGVRPG